MPAEVSLWKLQLLPDAAWGMLSCMRAWQLRRVRCGLWRHPDLARSMSTEVMSIPSVVILMCCIDRV